MVALLGARHFTVTVAGDEVERRKPHPDPYLAATRLLGVDPAACVVLEDSLTGAAAGVAAGCVTVLVPSMPIPPGQDPRPSRPGSPTCTRSTWRCSPASSGAPASPDCAPASGDAVPAYRPDARLTVSPRSRRSSVRSRRSRAGCPSGPRGGRGRPRRARPAVPRRSSQR
ncbi:HAD-IA family hydrolase [Parafrankia sp. EUN1f]|uniref:HAD-IA family hydrolase n=1 Tax=Parafrankia sp. EUN1f TaxID=102897 RepID=UPI00350EB9AB